MTTKQPQHQSAIGMVGLGVMGRNLILNMADHGFSVAGYDKNPNQVEALRKESADRNIVGTENLNDFIALLRPPRAVMMLVPAGAPVDSVIKDVLPHVDMGDLIIDAGNSYFKDTDERVRPVFGALAVKVNGDPCVTSSAHGTKGELNGYLMENMRKICVRSCARRPS